MTKTPKKTRKTGKKVAKPSVRTEEENAYLQEYNNRKSSKIELPEITIDLDQSKNEAAIRISVSDPEIGEAVLHNMFGTTDKHFFEGLLEQLSNTANADNKKFKFMLSTIAGFGARDQTEALLAAQMASVHMATMTFARRLDQAKTIQQQDSAERAFNKLTRTFTAQMEALNRYRGKGQQKMTVEHVHVHEGGQAIVGNVQGGGGNGKK